MTLDIALTGLTAASADLSTISNNIANNATNGFKRSDVEFSDLYARSTFGSTRDTAGQGVAVAQIRQDFAQGSLTFTDNNLDLSIEGQGMFELDDNGSSLYTRDGTFGLDREGYIVTAAGHRLTGYTTDDNQRIQPIKGDLQIDFSDLAPKPSETVTVAMNLDAETPVLPAFDVSDPSTFNYSTSATVYDSLGAAQVATLYVHKDTPNSWSSYLYVDGMEVSQPGGDELGFDSSGALATINGSPATTFTSTTFNPPSGAAAMALEFDVSAVTQFESPFGTNAISQDGHSAGRLDDFDVDASGVIFGRFTNGQSRVMGQVTLTNFANQQGLLQSGSNAWVQTFSSGEPVRGEPGSASLGLVQSGALEGSNVDVTEELVAMIGAQRSFQANAQVISTGDQLMQTVINIRR